MHSPAGIVAAALASLLLVACTGAPSVPAPSAAEISTAGPTSAPGAVHQPNRVAPPTRIRGPEQLAPPSVARPDQPLLAVRYEAALVDDHCVDRDLAAPPTADVALVVLDRTYGLPASYVPDDLVPASTAGLSGTSGTKLVRSIVVDDLAAMKRAWDGAGLTMLVESAYRSYASQAATFESWVTRAGHADALVRSARPGHSEHQLGTAIDVTSPGWGGRFGDWGRETAEGAWMAEHAWEYGFVMSYPMGSQADTCFSYEPWHYRWIGREAAAEHRSSGLFLRQYLERYVGD